MDRAACKPTLVRGVMLSALVCGLALGQQNKPAEQVAAAGQKASLPTRTGGLMGQPARLPNVLGRNRSLPLDRHITLPGLPAGTPTATVPTGQRGYVGRLPVYRTGDDGLRIEGDYEDGKFSLEFHLGSGSYYDGGRVYYPYGSRGYYVHNGRYYYDPSWYYYRRGTYLSTRPVNGVLTQQMDSTLLASQAPQPQIPTEPVRELTTIERATLLMAAEELPDAIEAYRDHLDEDPEDVKAMRALGLALIENNRLEDGVAMVALAYRTDPMLARSAMDLPELGLEGRRYTNLLARVLQFARRVDSGSAHLAGAVLLQADGKVAGAGRVLDRAERAGLAEEILDPMRRELGIPANGG